MVTQSLMETPLMEITKNQNMVFEVEAFLEEGFKFRRNVINGKVEMCYKGENKWNVLTTEAFNSLVIKALKDGVGGDASPLKVIEQFVRSTAIPEFNPIVEYINSLPEWDGKDYVSSFFRRLPEVDEEMLGFLTIWLFSAVAHWMKMDTMHGNECVPILIGEQGCGKSTFCNRLLPPELREYFFDHINFGNKFDFEMALTNGLFVNLDEFNVMTVSQQTKLKQLLSKVRGNSRPICGTTTVNRDRYASFVATTNERHPLCDPTGSRRFLCIQIPSGELIDNTTPIDYEQLYAQVYHQLTKEGAKYWFDTEQERRIQERNAPFMKTDNLEKMVTNSIHIGKSEEEGNWLSTADIITAVHRNYMQVIQNHSYRIKVGQVLKNLGCKTKRSSHGTLYLVELRN